MLNVDQLELTSSEVFVLQAAPGTRIQVSQGRLWITQHEGLEDVWLRVGEQWVSTAHARLYIGAEPQAVIVIRSPMHSHIGVSRLGPSMGAAILRYVKGQARLAARTLAPTVS